MLRLAVPARVAVKGPLLAIKDASRLQTAGVWNAWNSGHSAAECLSVDKLNLASLCGQIPAKTSLHCPYSPNHCHLQETYLLPFPDLPRRVRIMCGPLGRQHQLINCVRSGGSIPNFLQEKVQQRGHLPTEVHTVSTNFQPTFRSVSTTRRTPNKELGHGGLHPTRSRVMG